MAGDQLPELLTIGRIGVDIYGQELGQGLEDQQTFAKAVGGSATNVAVAAARLGHRAAVLTKVGDDSLGTYAIRDCEALAEFLAVDIDADASDREELRELIACHGGLPPDSLERSNLARGWACGNPYRGVKAGNATGASAQSTTSVVPASTTRSANSSDRDIRSLSSIQAMSAVTIGLSEESTETTPTSPESAAA